MTIRRTRCCAFSNSVAIGARSRHQEKATSMPKAAPWVATRSPKHAWHHSIPSLARGGLEVDSKKWSVCASPFEIFVLLGGLASDVTHAEDSRELFLSPDRPAR